MKINEACDYIILQTTSAGEGLNLLKLQKLLYYSQAWSLTIDDAPLFDGKFQAWIHGPVNRSVYNRFSDKQSMYSEIISDDIKDDFDVGALPAKKKRLIDSVLEVYASYTGSQLEEMTHNETPWITAREGYRSTERCEVEMLEPLMKQYYSTRLA